MAEPRQIEVPEDFGNDWMSNLEEIGIPDAVPFRPETPGWYILAGVLAMATVWLAWRLFQRWRANAYRREALRELSEIEGLIADDATREGALRSLPELLKRVALVAYPRARVADLSGDAWLGFLDGTIGSTAFTRGVGRLLPDLTYAPRAPELIKDDEVNDLVALVGSWIRHHKPDHDREEQWPPQAPGPTPADGAPVPEPASP